MRLNSSSIFFTERAYAWSCGFLLFVYQEGRTPMFAAMEKGHEGAFKELIDGKADMKSFTPV